jgi:hypothetical protein
MHSRPNVRLGRSASKAIQSALAKLALRFYYNRQMSQRLVMALAAVMLSNAQTVSPQRNCAQLRQFEAPAVEFSKAEAVPASASLPAYCLVKGVINKRTGAGGRQFGIGFELRLPDSWSERFLFQGGGGMDGVVRPATGAVPISGSTATPALARGFAVASTDSGHQGQGDPFSASADSSFGIDQQARVDQAYGGFIAVTELARRMIASYYGRPWKKSYFMGCSNGGRQALLAAQRFPLDFDGVLSVAPAARVGTATISSVWETIAFSQIAPKDAAGRPILSKAFSNADLSLLGQAVADACDAADGVKDGTDFQHPGVPLRSRGTGLQRSQDQCVSFNPASLGFEEGIRWPEEFARRGALFQLALRHWRRGPRLARAEAGHFGNRRSQFGGRPVDVQRTEGIFLHPTRPELRSDEV